MVGAVDQRCLDAHDRKACDRPLGEHRPEALLDRRDVFPRHTTTDHGIVEDEVLGRLLRERLERADDVGILARATGLLLVLVVVVGGLGGSLAVAHLRRTHLDFNLELALDPFDVDVEMQLAHAGDERFARLVVGGHAERRILAAEPLQGLTELVEAVAVGRRDRHLDHRLRHEHVLERAVFVVGGVGVAAGGVDAHHGHDVAGLARVDFLALVGVHLHDPAEPLLLAGPLVDVGLTLGDRALVDPHEGQLAVGVVDDLECHCHQRLLGIGGEVERLVGVVPLLGDHLPLQRAGQIPHDGVEQLLHALVLVGGATEDRRDALALHGRLYNGVNLVL